MNRSNDRFIDGFLVGISIVVLIFCLILMITSITDGNPCVEATELLTSDIRVMHTIDLGNDCKLVTDQGFVFYHDSMLFFEEK